MIRTIPTNELDTGNSYKMQLIQDILINSTSQYPERAAVQDQKSTLTYAELFAKSQQTAKVLQAYGLKPGDRCIVILPNSVDFVCAHFGILSAGGISVPCDAMIKTPNLQNVIINSKPHTIITDETGLDQCLPLINTDFHGIVLVHGQVSQFINSHNVVSLQSLSEDKALNFRQPDVQSDQIATIMYTTGTTSTPKGVKLSHSNVTCAISNISKFLSYTKDDKEVIVLPLSHNFGLGHLYCNIAAGGSVRIERGLSKPGRVLKALKEFGATGFPTTPLGIGFLIDRFGPALSDFGSDLRFMVINSAPLPPERTAQLIKLLPKTKIVVYYGLTEASRSTMICLSDLPQSMYRSVGKAMSQLELTIANEKGKPILPPPANQEGEIVIKGPTVTSGYWNNDTETEASIVDGWLHSGDTGVLDSEGYLTITGRIKDMVNIDGLKVNPAEVDQVLIQCPGVIDAASCGIFTGAGLASEILVAGLVVANGNSFSIDDCEKFCSNSLERFKVPTMFFIIDHIPKTESGKIMRRKLAILLQDKFSSRRDP